VIYEIEIREEDQSIRIVLFEGLPCGRAIAVRFTDENE
jgi:hypothetical protein